MARNVSGKLRIISGMTDKPAALGNPLAASGAASAKRESKSRKERALPPEQRPDTRAADVPAAPDSARKK